MVCQRGMFSDRPFIMKAFTSMDWDILQMKQMFKISGANQ